MAVDELDDLILLQREMTAEIIVGDETDHARFKVGNQPSRHCSQYRVGSEPVNQYDAFALNLWVLGEISGRQGAQFDGTLSVKAYERWWQKLAREQRDELDGMLRLYPGAKMGVHARGRHLRGSSE